MKRPYVLVGMKHRGTEALVATLPDGEPLTLMRERTNPHDPNAVQVWARGQHVGYVRATQVRTLTMAMDSADGLRVGSFQATISFSPNSRIPQVNVDDKQGME